MGDFLCAAAAAMNVMEGRKNIQVSLRYWGKFVITHTHTRHTESHTHTRTFRQQRASDWAGQVLLLASLASAPWLIFGHQSQTFRQAEARGTSVGSPLRPSRHRQSP